MKKLISLLFLILLITPATAFELPQYYHLKAYQYPVFEERNDLFMYACDFKNVDSYYLAFGSEHENYTNSNLWMANRDPETLNYIFLTYENGNTVDAVRHLPNVPVDDYEYWSDWECLLIVFEDGRYRHVDWWCSDIMQYENITEYENVLLCFMRAYALYELEEYEKAIYYAEISKNEPELEEKSNKIIDQSRGILAGICKRR